MLETPVTSGLDSVNFIQMADDIVAVYFHALDPGLIIWNWRTGNEVVVRCVRGAVRRISQN